MHFGSTFWSHLISNQPDGFAHRVCVELESVWKWITILFIQGGEVLCGWRGVWIHVAVNGFASIKNSTNFTNKWKKIYYTLFFLVNTLWSREQVRIIKLESLLFRMVWITKTSILIQVKLHRWVEFKTILSSSLVPYRR